MEEERLVKDRPHGQYGSCGRQNSYNHNQNLNCVKHPVQPSDTLQGLALKYRTTTEKIRRVNRLYATESLFLREYLMIPVTKDVSLPEDIPKQNTTITHRASVAGIPSSTNEFSYGSPDEKKTFDEFLSRVDSSLASIKKDVEKTSEKSEFGKYSAELYMRKRPTSRLKQSSSVGSGVGTSAIVTVMENDNSYHGTMGETVVMADGRHVRSSLQRLQRTQDDWFQL